MTLRFAEVDFDLANAARRVIEGSLGVVAGERVVIVVDKPREALGTSLAETARSGHAEAELVVLEQFGGRPLRTIPDALRAVLSRSQASVLLIGFDDGEAEMRGEYIALAAQQNLRHAHMIGISRRAMLAGFSVDSARILDAARAVRMRLRPDSVLQLRSASGSDLEVKLSEQHRWHERVGLVRPGRWEHLPSGALFTCPLDVNGVFVADASVGGQFGAAVGVLTRSPVRVAIQGGVVRTVQCIDRSLAHAVETALRAVNDGDRACIVRLGLNVGMRDSMGEIVADENMPGLHLGFGGLQAADGPWDAPKQLSMAAVGADVDLDGAALLREGRYTVL